MRMAYSPRMPADDHLVPLAEIEAARARIAGLVHRTPLLSSATAACVDHRGDRRAGRPTAGST